MSNQIVWALVVFHESFVNAVSKWVWDVEGLLVVWTADVWIGIVLAFVVFNVAFVSGTSVGCFFVVGTLVVKADLVWASVVLDVAFINDISVWYFDVSGTLVVWMDVIDFPVVTPSVVTFSVEEPTFFENEHWDSISKSRKLFTK